MSDLLTALQRQQAQNGRERKNHALVSAKVTGIMPDGTYEVSYLTMDDGEPSAPARVVMPSAGAKRGFHFMPDVGDEVIIGFHCGDLNAPLILGAAFNDDSQPPDQAKPSTNNNVRTIVSRSGHEITFDDTPGDGKVTIKTCGGHRVLLCDSPPKLEVATAGGSSIAIDDTVGSLKISATTQIEIAAPSIKLSATTMTINAPGGIQLTTTGSAPGSAVVIDGKPFGAHVHVPPVVAPPGTTGPVAP